MQDAVSASLDPAITYPERDGKPMGETDVHRQEIVNAIETLTDFFRDDPETYVAGDLLLYYEEGNPKAVVVPDVFVVRGVAKQERRIYKLWEEGEPPCLVIEVTSRSSRLDDLGNKRVLYAMLGVTEYFIFDPLGEYLSPKLQGFRLHEGELQRIACIPQEVISSETLGLRLEVDGNQLRLVDLSTGERLMTPAEVRESERTVRKSERAEAAARKAAEQRVKELEEEMARLRRQLAD